VAALVRRPVYARYRSSPTFISRTRPAGERAAKLLTGDEARRIAANIAELPDLLLRLTGAVRGMVTQPRDVRLIYRECLRAASRRPGPSRRPTPTS
jgi:hypothetical protein